VVPYTFSVVAIDAAGLSQASGPSSAIVMSVLAATGAGVGPVAWMGGLAVLLGLALLTGRRRPRSTRR